MRRRSPQAGVSGHHKILLSAERYPVRAGSTDGSLDRQWLRLHVVLRRGQGQERRGPASVLACGRRAAGRNRPWAGGALRRRTGWARRQSPQAAWRGREFRTPNRVESPVRRRSARLKPIGEKALRVTAGAGEGQARLAFVRDVFAGTGRIEAFSEGVFGVNHHHHGARIEGAGVSSSSDRVFMRGKVSQTGSRLADRK